jgi:hypothetical protein
VYVADELLHFRPGKPRSCGRLVRWRVASATAAGTEIVQVGHRRQAFEHVGQPDLRLVAVAFGAIAHPPGENPRQFRLPLRPLL